MPSSFEYSAARTSYASLLIGEPTPWAPAPRCPMLIGVPPVESAHALDAARPLPPSFVRCLWAPQAWRNDGVGTCSAAASRAVPQSTSQPIRERLGRLLRK